MILFASLLSFGLISCENKGSGPEKPDDVNSSSENQTQSSSSSAGESSSSKIENISSGENAESSSSVSVVSTTGIFTDSRDGREYKTYSLKKNGSGIIWFAEKLAFGSQTGFDYSAATQACPSDFRLPNDNDWSLFADEWNSGNITPESSDGLYWSATKGTTTSYASIWRITGESIEMFANYGYLSDPYSVLCVKDFADTEIFTDSRDGKKYKTGNPGNGTVWFLQELNFNDQQEFTWNEATEACPAGWHLPDDSEWKSLLNWKTPFRKEFTETSRGNWWSSSENENLNYAHLWRVRTSGIDDTQYVDYTEYAGKKTDKNSVRCVKD